MMYKGRSIGRMLAWLYELTPRADYLIFHPDGRITMGHDGPVVVEKTEWDEYDNPTFVFVNESEAEMLRRQRIYRDLRGHEFRHLYYSLHKDYLKTLQDLERGYFTANQSRIGDIPDAYKALIHLGLAECDKTFSGWDGQGHPLHNIEIEISPQGRGFLKMYQQEKEIKMEEGSDD